MAKKTATLSPEEIASGVNMSPDAAWRQNSPESPGLDFSGEDGKSLTTQSDRKSCDLNEIFKKHLDQGGMIPDPVVGNRPPMYGDFSMVGDFAEQMRTVKRIENTFQLLSAPIRARFNNQPEELIKFLSDPKNNDEAVKLGLRPKPKVKLSNDKEPAPAKPEAGQPANPAAEPPAK